MLLSILFAGGIARILSPPFSLHLCLDQHNVHYINGLVSPRLKACLLLCHWNKGHFLIDKFFYTDLKHAYSHR